MRLYTRVVSRGFEANKSRSFCVTVCGSQFWLSWKRFQRHSLTSVLLEPLEICRSAEIARRWMIWYDSNSMTIVDCKSSHTLRWLFETNGQAVAFYLNLALYTVGLNPYFANKELIQFWVRTSDPDETFPRNLLSVETAISHMSPPWTSTRSS